MPIVAAARLTMIRRHLDRLGVIRTTALAAELGVSERTLQRDLDTLEEARLLRRVHGGAVPWSREADGARLRIGLILPTQTAYFDEVIAGVRMAAAQLNAQIVLGDYDYRDEVATNRLDVASSLDLDGLLVTVDQQGADYEQLAHITVPTVMIERPQLPGTDGLPVIAHVGSDHATGGVMAVQHLVDAGHDRIWAMIRRTPTGDAILRGFRTIPHAVSDRLQVREVSRSESITADDAYILEALAAIGRGDATALFVHHDYDVLVVLEALAQAGLDVPGDVSILTYDDVPHGHDLTTPVGHRAAAALDRPNGL